MAATRRGRPLGAGRIDRAKVDSTTDEDVRRSMREDGFDPDEAPGPYRVMRPAAHVQQRTGLSQEAFAKAINVPVATIRNWEQGRTIPDPAAQSLLALVHADPEGAFKHLAPIQPARTQAEEGNPRARSPPANSLQLRIASNFIGMQSQSDSI